MEHELKNTLTTPRRGGAIAGKLLMMGMSVALTLPPSARATEVAPYFEGWAFGGGMKPNSLMQAKNEGGLTAATIAFGVSGGGCTLGGGMDNIMRGAGKTDAQQFLAGGGHLILSFGGASGQYLESACSENDMFNLIKNVIDTHKVYALDFDIEGGQLDVGSLNERRNKVLLRLQQAYPNLYLSFTLPVDPSGLPGGAVNVLRGANNAGVKVSVVNIMAMDYGAGWSAGKKTGDLAIAAANATFNQIKGIFGGRSDAQLWAMIGITPMIGVNDVQSEVFRQSDAQQVTEFAKQKGIGLIAMWALQRDQVGSAGGKDSYSMVNTKPYEFYKIFAAAKNGNTPPNTPPPAGGVANGRYTIVSAFSGKCVDVSAAAKEDGAKLQQYLCNRTGAQQFDVANMGNGAYRIINVNSGKAVDVPSASGDDGVQLQQWSDNGSNAQRFAIKVAADPTEFTVKNVNSGKCLDVADWSSNDGGKIQQWICGNGQNQKFKFLKFQ